VKVGGHRARSAARDGVSADELQETTTSNKTGTHAQLTTSEAETIKSTSAKKTGVPKKAIKKEGDNNGEKPFKRGKARPKTAVEESSEEAEVGEA
jgi:hypothetical protein